LCGPIAPTMSRGNEKFLLLVDDLSKYMWVAVIPFKDRAMAAIKEIQARAEGESDLKLRALRTKREGEFTAIGSWSTARLRVCIVSTQHLTTRSKMA
jgi:hypothetical protein